MRMYKPTEIFETLHKPSEILVNLHIYVNISQNFKKFVHSLFRSHLSSVLLFLFCLGGENWFDPYCQVSDFVRRQAGST